MDKPFAITLDVGSSLANKTGSWRTMRPTCHPCLIASSPRNRSTELMPTASSSEHLLQAVSHGW